jgi:hypothetical protein
VRRVELAEGQAITDVPPSELTLEHDRQSLVGKEPVLESDDQRGGIDQIDEADSQRR